jgi:hypothetical protein
MSLFAGSLSIDGSANPNNFTGIEADSSERATGDAGNVTIRVDDTLRVAGSGGGITAITSSSGNGGNLTIHAGSLSIDGSATPSSATGIFAASYGSGKAGNIGVRAESLSIDGSAKPGDQIGIFAASYESGAAGSVSIETAGPVILKRGASISTSSETTDAGSINIISGGEIKLKEQINKPYRLVKRWRHQHYDA